MAEKETIITKMYDLVKYLIPIVNRFPRDYKFTLGDRMTNLVLDLLEQYIQAYYERFNRFGAFVWYCELKVGIIKCPGGTYENRTSSPGRAWLSN